jgi:hypothetical protein
MMLISVELFIMLCIPLFIPGDCGPCFIGFAIGESLGAPCCAWCRWHSPRSPTSALT